MVDGILDASRLNPTLSASDGKSFRSRTLSSMPADARTESRAHKVEIEFAIPDALPPSLPTGKHGHVIVNLGTNACKYAGEKGKIKIWARYNSDSRHVTIGVTDSGPGISPEHVKLIFDRYQQVPDDQGREKGGFGLGLHIASELVRVNFGTLSVESAPQKGSTFAFTLPTFDVNSLIPLHFSFLRTARQSFNRVSIAVVTAAAECGQRRTCRCRALPKPAAPFLRPLAPPARGQLACLRRRGHRRPGRRSPSGSRTPMPKPAATGPRAGCRKFASARSERGR